MGCRGATVLRGLGVRGLGWSLVMSLVGRLLLLMLWCLVLGLRKWLLRWLLLWWLLLIEGRPLLVTPVAVGGRGSTGGRLQLGLLRPLLTRPCSGADTRRVVCRCPRRSTIGARASGCLRSHLCPLLMLLRPSTTLLKADQEGQKGGRGAGGQQAGGGQARH